MGAYRHILAALDFGPDSDQVIQRAATLAKTEGARLSLIHVVEFLNMDLANELVLPQDVELESQIATAAKRKLGDLAGAVTGIGPIAQWVEVGSTKQEIIRVAEEQAVDLIIVGSHGRHGLGRLLGSTAIAVLNGAGCDVLAVRIKQTA